MVAGIVSHSPAGLGVFETLMQASLPAQPSAGLLAAMLLCFRLIYSLLPRVLANLARAQLDGG